MKLLLVTDAWLPQVNGVVRTWQNVLRELREMGHETAVIDPAQFRTFAAPRYPEIRLAILPRSRVAKLINQHRPDALHIATEGPLGQAARHYCLKHNRPFSSSYHTQFPQYLRHYFGIPQSWTYAFVRRFHGKAKHTLVPTPTVSRELAAKGLTNTVTWSRGVDLTHFHDGAKHDFKLPRPIFLYAGRVAVEKNIEAFLSLELPGSKVVVGDGPIRPAMQAKYPSVHFAGYKFGPDLAAHYAGADVFVFPSKTDTFGVVMLEANACGLPVAALPVTGPIDVVKPGRSGCLHHDLRQACLEALTVPRESCIAYARENSWRRCAQILLDHLALAPSPTSSNPGMYSSPDHSLQHQSNQA